MIFGIYQALGYLGPKGDGLRLQFYQAEIVIDENRRVPCWSSVSASLKACFHKQTIGPSCVYSSGDCAISNVGGELNMLVYFYCTPLYVITDTYDIYI